LPSEPRSTVIAVSEIRALVPASPTGVEDMVEAIEGVKRCPNPSGTLALRPFSGDPRRFHGGKPGPDREVRSW
jgi:hypothetical protein